jgi:glycosyltransferase involved in cell wall biosynthesis
MRNADALLVSTPHLGEAYSGINDQIYVIENSLDFKGDRKFVGWDKVSVRQHKGLRLGWIGGRAHFADLMMVAPALRGLLERNPDVTLCLVNSALRQSCLALDQPYPFEGLKNVHYADRSVPINRYAPFFASFGFDIGIAPLVDCNFNRSKSNLRFLEYSALKIPTVATDISHFSQTIRHGYDGWLVKENDPALWQSALEFIIHDENRRIETGRQAYKRVKKDFNVARNAPQYLRLLKDLANQQVDVPEESAREVAVSH